MGNIDLSGVVASTDLAENFTILRGSGSFGPGGWSQTTTVVPMFGVVSVAKQKELEAIPEGDKITEALVFHSTQQMFVTNAANSQTSDVIQWQGDNFRIIAVANYSNRGYWRAIATRMAGN